MIRLSSLCLTLLMAACAPIAGRADIIVNTFGPGNSFNDVAVGLVSYDQQQAILGRGFQFVPQASSYLLDQISLPLSGSIYGRVAAVTVYNDALGQPGQPLETLQITGLGSLPQIFTVTSVTRPLLEENQVYYLVASQLSAAQAAYWNFSPGPGVGVSVSGPYPDGHWLVNPSFAQTAFAISGTPVPEPAFGFICGALVILLLTPFRWPGFATPIHARRRG